MSVTISNGVSKIGSYAFFSCNSLASITIPDSVTCIGVNAFGWCTSLTSVTIPDSVTSLGQQAFYSCTSLTNVTIPDSITSIGKSAFERCSSLTGVYFKGNAPSVGSAVFSGDNTAVVYYLPGTTGWGVTFGDRPTALWLPQLQSGDAGFGVRTNQFGFDIYWASGRVVVVEACTNLANLVWSPVSTNTLTDGWSYFSDPDWTNYPGRFHRIRSQ